MTVKSRERIESAIHDLRHKTGEYEEVGKRLLEVAEELEVAAKGVFEQTRGTTNLIAGEFRDDFGKKGEYGARLEEQSQYSGEGDEFDRWLASHKDEVRHMICDNPDYQEAGFCQTH